MRAKAASFLALFSLVLAVAASGQAPAIQYAEPVALALGGPGAQFDAYGRRFSLSLADNSRVLEKLPAVRKAELASYQLLRGSLDGQPGSWVRLTRTPAGVEGAIWDGAELYAVTTYGKVAGQLTTPLDAAPDQTVVYRLSDVRDALPRDFCALGEDTAAAKQATGLDHYKALTAELAKADISRQVEISLIGDATLQQKENDPTAAMLARLNIVEGIFAEQLDLLILATDVRLMPLGSDPLTSTKGSTLLEQLGNYRSANSAVRQRALAHLVTGKDLEGGTAGIAYVGALCKGDRGVSISEHQYGTTLSALIMAHELGHNFGAYHDGEVDTPCASETGTFIMAPAVSGTTRFSLCSRNVMLESIANAACVSAADYADAEISTQFPNVAGEGGAEFTLPFVVKSTGSQTVRDVVATVTLPTIEGYQLEAASASNGPCTIYSMRATCQLGEMAPGTQATINVVAKGRTAQNFTVSGRVTGSNDRVTSDGEASIAVAIRSGVDAAVLLSTNAAEVPLGAPVEVYADVSSLRSLPLRNAVLSVNVNQPVVSATMAGATCTPSAYSVSCTIADLAAHTTRRLTLRATASVAGPLFAGASVNVSGEGDATNNTANAKGWVQAEHDVAVTAGPASVDVGIGAVHEIQYFVRSRGFGQEGDVALLISINGTVTVDSLDASCTPVNATTYRCALGAFAPGDARVVTLQVHGAGTSNVSISASAVTAGDGYAGNDGASTLLRIDHALDLAVVMASGGSGVEDSAIEGQITLRSQGRTNILGGSVDIVLHAAGVLRSAKIHNGAACELTSARSARCALPLMVRDQQVYVDYVAEFAEPGGYDVAFTAVAAGDTAPTNNALTRAVLVRPYNDIAIAGSLSLELVAGQSRELTFTVTTDRRSLASARFVAPHYMPGLLVTAIRATAGECEVDDFQGGVCDFSNLPANASVAVTVTYRAEQAAFVQAMAATVSTTGDVTSGNDAVRGRVETFGPTDLELRGGGSVSGTAGVAVALPEISVVNGADKAIGARLEVTLPAQVALVSVSAANAICSGTTVVRCDFTDLPANTTTAVSISVRPSTSGAFSAAMKVSAANDTNAANDQKSVSLDIAAGASVAKAPAGKSGGGSMEWLTLVFLMGVIALRLRRPWQIQER